MTYGQLKDILNRMNADLLDEQINFEYLNNIIQNKQPTAVQVGNKPITPGNSNPFAGTSWGN